MVGEKSDGEKARKIVGLLPKKNCGKCGFDNCGGFALAVAGGKASPFGCQENPSAGYGISKVLGIEVPEKTKLQAGMSPGLGTVRSIGLGGGRGSPHGFGRGRGRGGHRGGGKRHGNPVGKRHH